MLIDENKNSYHGMNFDDHLTSDSVSLIAIATGYLFKVLRLKYLRFTEV